jgi:hypothetical protein
LAQLDSARQRARLARTNALASVSRLRAEPRTPATTIERSDALLASSHRFVRAVMALEAGLYHGSITPATAARPLRRLSDDVDLTLGALIAHVCDESTSMDVPDLRDDERRLARSLATDGQASAVLAVQADRIANTLGTMVRSLSYTA